MVSTASSLLPIRRATSGDSPCARCPWVVDSPREFPPEVFQHSAKTAYDCATHTFGCHVSGVHRPATCAGFLLRGATHNLHVRLYGPGEESVHISRPLHANYRAMAIANGVDPDDPALARCRDSGYETHDDPGET